MNGTAVMWSLLFVATWLLFAVVIEGGAWQVAVSCILVIAGCVMDIRDKAQR